MRYPLYGNDIDNRHTPLEAGLAWIVKLGTGFIGEEALLRQKETGPRLRLTGLEMVDPGIVRDGCLVSVPDGEPAVVTSGGYGPSLEKSIGLAYLPASASTIGQSLSVDIRGKMRQAKVVETPFYRKSA
jgi:aminomethyltransferase